MARLPKIDSIAVEYHVERSAQFPLMHGCAITRRSSRRRRQPLSMGEGRESHSIRVTIVGLLLLLRFFSSKIKRKERK